MEQILIALFVAGCIGIVLSMVIFFLASRRKARAVSNGRAKPAQAERVNDGGSGVKRGRGGKDKITGASSLDPIVSDRPQKKIAVKIKNHTDKKGGHPHIILGDVDENHVSVGLTTKPKKGKNSTNYKMEVSPLGDGRQSYMRRQGTVAPKGEYKQPRSGSITEKDFAKAKEYGEKAKQKYLNEKTQKKSNECQTPKRHQP